jgi:hypothetical protein
VRGTWPEAEKNSISVDLVFCTKKSTSAIPSTTPIIKAIHVQLVRVGPRAIRRARVASWLFDDAREAFIPRDSYPLWPVRNDSHCRVRRCVHRPQCTFPGASGCSPECSRRGAPTSGGDACDVARRSIALTDPVHRHFPRRGSYSRQVTTASCSSSCSQVRSAATRRRHRSTELETRWLLPWAILNTAANRGVGRLCRFGPSALCERGLQRRHPE